MGNKSLTREKRKISRILLIPKFQVVLIVSLVEIPGFLFSGLTMDVFGRKPIMIFMLFSSAVCKIAAAIITFMSPTYEGYIAACVLMSKMCVASTYTIIR